MIERYGLVGTEHGGIFFTEAAAPPSSHVLGTVSVRKNRQNWDLFKIKDELVRQAEALGANAIVEFKYGQRAHKWYRLLLPVWDHEAWHGDGVAVRI